MKKELGRLYENDEAAYIANYRPVKPDFCSEQEYGMKLFRICVRTMMNQNWEMAGQAALRKSVDMLRTRATTLLELTDLPVLISMNAEGNSWDHTGIKYFGIAALDLREFCQEEHRRPVIHSANYILNSSASRRKFLFNSSSQRIAWGDMATLRDVISSSLFIPDPLTGGATYRRVILVWLLRCARDTMSGRTRPVP